MTVSRTILVIDDEPAIRKFLRVSLESQQYEVVEALTGKDGIREAIGVRPDVIVLDMGLPDIDGIEVIQQIRSWSQVPIVVLTVKEDEATKIRALDAGADDYLTKPFSIPELMARLRVAERHANTIGDEGPVFKSGSLEVDLNARVVKVRGKEVRLTATEYDILKLFVKHAGKVVTHRQILQEIWGPNAVEHTQYLRVYVGFLRKKLETDKTEKIIATEPGVGYRLLLL